MPHDPVKPLTILLTESSKGYGGQERRLLHEAMLLRRAGHWPIIACPPDAPLCRHATEEGMQLLAVPMRNSLQPATVYALYSLIRSAGVDIIYSHSGKDSWLAGFAGLLSGIPLVRSRELLNPVRHGSSYALIPRRVLACSAAVREQLLAVGVPAHKVFIQYPPVATSRFAAVNDDDRERCRQELGLAGRFPVIACVARFMGEKRQVDVVEAMATVRKTLPTALLLLVGSGPERDSLTVAVAAADLQDVVLFTGEREDVPALLANSHISVLPSCREPFGMAPVEAMAAGVPVVVTRTGGLAEIVTDGVNGLHVPVEDPPAIAAAIMRICADQTLRQQLIAAGRERAADFDEDSALLSLLGHFQAVVYGR